MMLCSSRHVILAALAVTTIARAADPPKAVVVLAERCLKCHNASPRMSGLSLASAADARKGGLHGPAIVPGKPEQSLLLGMISGDKPKMPMGDAPLSPAQVAEIRTWIEQGAQWPDAPTAGSGKAALWSLQPLTKPTVPQSESRGARNPIDAFVAAKLAEKNLTPSAEADAATLIRRLTYDLHGLPPTWQEIQSFVADRSPDAYEKLVDRLLASPRYGERWGRHWLDVAHYGESHGYDKDKPRRNAWPYRDYVIRAFNQDKPYARFVEEQLAGDVLWPDDPQATVATGFIAAGPWDFVGHAELREGTTDKDITRLLDRDDMVQTTMSAFVSMTAHCARCHDHKFDPIPQEDYYSLQAVFAGVDRADRPYDADPKIYAARRVLLEKRRALMTQLRPLQDEVASISSPELKNLDDTLTALKFDFAETRKPELQPRINQLTADRKAMVQALVRPGTRDGIARLNAELQAVDKDLEQLGKPQLVYAAANFFDPQGTFTFAIQPRPITVLQRGSVESPGKPVGPGALSCVPGLPARFALKDGEPEGARRAALAHWITARDNMLTWRSIVNRVWQYHFGDGPRGFCQRLRTHGLHAHPSGTARLAGRHISRPGRLAQTAPQADPDVCHVAPAIRATSQPTPRPTRRIATSGARTGSAWTPNRCAMPCSPSAANSISPWAVHRPSSSGSRTITRRSTTIRASISTVRPATAAASTASSCAARRIPSWTAWIAPTRR